MTSLPERSTKLANFVAACLRGTGSRRPVALAASGTGTVVMFVTNSSSMVANKPRVSIGAAVDPAEVIAIAASMQARGRQLLSSGSPLEAIPHLALAIQVLRRHPAACLDSWARAYAELGEALLAVDRWSTARSNLQQSLALEPSARVQELLTRVDAAQRECRRACVATMLQRAWRAHHAAVPALRAAVRLQAAARGSSVRRLLQTRPSGPPPIECSCCNPTEFGPGEGQQAQQEEQAERLLQLLREAGELTRDGAVWGRIRVAGAQLWQLQRLCSDLSTGVASMSEIALAASVPPSLPEVRQEQRSEPRAHGYLSITPSKSNLQVRQQQCELRGFIYRRDASELFYRKATLTLQP